jgi:glycosyltransferase involved in cell wall biosynthesis
MKEKISIVMPAYNEGSRIASSIEETVRVFDSFGYPWELIVMDDGSSDDTYERAYALTSKYPQLIVKRNPVNMGKGRAMKKSMHYISGDYTLFLDADMDLHPVQFQTLFDIMGLDKADIVIGSKLHPNSIVKYPFQRKIISFVYYLLVKAMFNLPCHDTQTGLKLFKTEVLRHVLPRVLVKQFAFDLEVLVNAHRLGYKIVEAPIILKPQRQYGRIGAMSLITTGWDTLAIFYRMYILKYYDRIDNNPRKDLAKES